ncbi:MAG: PAS domain S-box protein [Syntrophomonas sp.]
MRDYIEKTNQNNVNRPDRSPLTDQFSALAENTASPIFVAQKGKFVYVNPAFARLAGYTPEELYRMENAWDIVSPESRHLVKARFFARESRQEVPANYEMEIITSHGDTRWVDYSGVLIEYAGMPAILGSGVDLTERKKAEQSGRESELLYRTIFETSGTAMMIFGEDMLISLVNHEFEKLSGYLKAEIEDIKKWPEFIAAKDLPKMKQYHVRRRIDPASVPSNYEFQLINRQGNIRDIYITVNLIPGTKDSVVSFMDITDRKQMENSLKESEARWQFALEGSGEGVWDWNLKTNEVFFSPCWKAMLGYKDNEIENEFEEWDKRVHPDDKENCYVQIEKCLQGETTLYQNEHRILCKDGNYKWILDRGKIVERSADNAPLRMIGTHADITDRKQMEELEKEQHRQLEQIIELLPDATLVISQAGEVLFWNKAIEEMTGVPKSEMIGRKNNEYAVPFYGEPRSILIDLALMDSHEPMPLVSNYDFIHREGDNLRTEISVTFRGQREYLWGMASKLYDASGNTIGAIESIRDITQRKKAETERENALAQLQAMFNEHNAVMLLIEPCGRISDANPAACTFYGYSREELLNMNIQEINLLPRDEVERHQIKALEHKQRYFLFPHRLKNGEIRLVDVYSCPVTHNGEAILFSIIFDVTDRERYREELFWEKELLRATLLSIGDGVFTTDQKGNVTSINHVAERLTGWMHNTAIGKPLDEVFVLIDEFSRERCENPAYKVLETGDIIDSDSHTILISKDGIERPIENIATPIKGEDDQIRGVVIIFRDFTEKKERQAKIEYLSYHDQLTGLYNRRFFEEELRRLDTERNLPLTLVMGDINGLKLTNDAFGHMAGDKLLRRVAEVIKNSCRADDIVARFGGDEFIILLPQTEADEAKSIVKRINEVLQHENTSAIPLSISFGWETKRSLDEQTMEVFKKAEDYMYRRKLSESASMRNKTVKVIMKTLYEKNEREEQHSARVSQLCQALGLALDLSLEDINELKTVGLMHDIGKIILDDRILDKPESLSDDEFAEIKRHAETGYRILSSVNEFAQLAEYVLAHHERWDGQGYPKGLQGEAIPLQSRIIAIADTYDAITSDRPYRDAMDEEFARAEIVLGSGTQFDPHIAGVFLDKVLK